MAVSKIIASHLMLFTFLQPFALVKYFHLTLFDQSQLQILGRMIRVDHVEDYKKPKEHGNEDEVTMKLRAEGCAPKLPDSPEEMSSEEEPLQVKVKVKKGI